LDIFTYSKQTIENTFQSLRKATLDPTEIANQLENQVIFDYWNIFKKDSVTDEESIAYFGKQKHKCAIFKGPPTKDQMLKKHETSSNYGPIIVDVVGGGKLKLTGLFIGTDELDLFSQVILRRFIKMEDNIIRRKDE